jgi:DNA-binding PadR family transcriptional regulator
MPPELGKRRPVSNPLGLAILAQLLEKPAHPYEMAVSMRQRGKHESIKLNYGSLYTVIGALERAGFIAVGRKVRQGVRPERTVYKITAAGEAELFDWMRDLAGTPVKEYPQFEAALCLLPVLPPDEAKALLQKRVRLLEEKLDGLRRASDEVSRRGVPRLLLIETEYHAAMWEAERKWVAGLVRLMNTSPGFTREWKAWHKWRRDSGEGSDRGERGES